MRKTITLDTLYLTTLPWPISQEDVPASAFRSLRTSLLPKSLPNIPKVPVQFSSKELDISYKPQDNYRSIKHSCSRTYTKNSRSSKELNISHIDIKFHCCRTVFWYCTQLYLCSLQIQHPLVNLKQSDQFDLKMLRSLPIETAPPTTLLCCKQPAQHSVMYDNLNRQLYHSRLSHYYSEPVSSRFNRLP